MTTPSQRKVHDVSPETWWKACDCAGATATRGRRIIGLPERLPGGAQRFIIATHPEPVCDACDTPWTRFLDAP